MSDSLTQVREKIDTLDNKIHDLLMQRAELIREVSAIKHKSGRPIVHPAREASMLRRLLGRHKGTLPQATIIGIWRELVGGVSMLQRGLHAYVSTQGDQQYCWDMAKDYCGSVIPMTRTSESSQAIVQVRDNIDAIAVLPWPSSDSQNNAAAPWWCSLLQDENDPEANQQYKTINIIAALPFGRQQNYDSLEHRSLVVNRMEYLPSGDDNSFILIASPTPISRGFVIDLLKEQGHTVLSLYIHTDKEQTMMLVEVKGYIAPDSDLMKTLNAKIPDAQSRCQLIGGYPVPPVLRDGDSSPLALTNEESTKVE